MNMMKSSPPSFSSRVSLCIFLRKYKQDHQTEKQKHLILTPVVPMTNTITFMIEMTWTFLNIRQKKDETKQSLGPMWLHIFIVYLISKATSHMCFLFGTWSLFLVFALKNIFQTSYWIADKNVQVPKRNYKLNGWVTERQWDSQVHQFHLSS